MVIKQSGDIFFSTLEKSIQSRQTGKNVSEGEPSGFSYNVIRTVESLLVKEPEMKTD